MTLMDGVAFTELLAIVAPEAAEALNKVLGRLRKTSHDDQILLLLALNFQASKEQSVTLSSLLEQSRTQTKKLDQLLKVETNHS